MSQTHRRLALADLESEAADAFGPHRLTWAYSCPRCDNTATGADFAQVLTALGTPEPDKQAVELNGTVCIGTLLSRLVRPEAFRSLAGCDWTADAFLPGPWEIQQPDGTVRWSFPLAPKAPAVLAELAPDVRFAAALLLAGRSIAEVGRRTGHGRHALTRLRDRLGLPRRTPGPRPATLTAVLADRVDPDDDGHLIWVAETRPSDGMPIASYRGIQTTAYRLMWLLRTGVWPTGTVRPRCGEPGCVAMGCLVHMARPSLAAAVRSMDHLQRLIDERTEPVEPGGHLRWTSYIRDGSPMLRVGDATTGLSAPAVRFLWLLKTGTEPVGTVRRRPSCDFPGCMRFEHRICHPPRAITT